MRITQRQSGAITLGKMLNVVIFGVLLLIFVRLIPVYVDYFTVVSVAKSVMEDDSLLKKGRVAMRQAINQRFRINNLRALKASEALVIRMGDKDDGIKLLLDYEVRTPLLGNLDGVLVFKREFSR
ncbi:MAG: DUF4845 domain-containing protein [Gammaproteobacteria bacterium]|nr:DUF4845 domain-containing protein [Gammaproteobacteria bacterium]